MKKNLKEIIKYLLFSFLVLPSSTNFSLDGFSFGNAGGSSIGSSNYSMNASVGEVSTQNLSGTSYAVSTGLANVLQSNVPMFVTFDNPGNYYNKLRFILDEQENPSDTRYAIAISDDNFITTKFVKSDNTVGLTLEPTDYQTYLDWGGSIGTEITGLEFGTQYSIKAKAIQGIFTETDYGPYATASTFTPQLTFDLDTASTDTETASPYIVSFGDLASGVVNTATNKIWIDIDTNAVSGANVYIYSKNNGLYSTTALSLIDAVTGNLDALGIGIGIRNDTVTQTSGLLTVLPPYNVLNNNVGIVDNSLRSILISNSPIVAGRASFLVKAKINSSTTAATDYSETYTIIASANF